jgi:hypothetical protein
MNLDALYAPRFSLQLFTSVVNAAATLAPLVILPLVVSLVHGSTSLALVKNKSARRTSPVGI